MTNIAIAIILVLVVPTPVIAEQVLFTNVKVFDGLSNKVTDEDVLIEDNLIKKVGKNIAAPEGARVINGGGRTLMPGLIDSHVHLNMYKDGTLLDLQNTTWEEIGARAAAMAKELLAMGFTTVRDMCGAHSDLKNVIDAGLVEGPRVYLAGACLSQSGGHGDWGIAGQRKGESNLERLGTTRLVRGHQGAESGMGGSSDIHTCPAADKPSSSAALILPWRGAVTVIKPAVPSPGHSAMSAVAWTWPLSVCVKRLIATGRFSRTAWSQAPIRLMC